MKELDITIYPSDVKSIAVYDEGDTYGGAHSYVLNNCLGYSDGMTHYDESTQQIQFVYKGLDGQLTAGITNDQLVQVLIDRLTKLNAVFSCDSNEKQLEHLNALAQLMEDRIKERESRNVMGELKK